MLTCHLNGSARDIEEAMRLAQANGADPTVEHMPLSQASEGLARTHEGKPCSRIGLHPADEQ